MNEISREIDKIVSAFATLGVRLEKQERATLHTLLKATFKHVIREVYTKEEIDNYVNDREVKHEQDKPRAEN